MIARLWVRLSAFLLSALPTLVLTIGLVGMLSYSVDQAGWVKDSRPISNLMISGLIIGWLLAASRLRGWRSKTPESTFARSTRIAAVSLKAPR